MNPDNKLDRKTFFARAGDADTLEQLQGIVRAAIADQIADDDPPETWATAQRLMSLGLTSEETISQISLTLTTHLSPSRDNPEMDRDAEYLAGLTRLPLPLPSSLWKAWEQVVTEHQPVDGDSAKIRILQLLEREPEDPAMEVLLETVLKEMVEHDVLDVLTDERIVHLDELCAGIWLTHRLTSDELDEGFIDATGDLAPFSRYQQLRLADGSPIEVADEDSELLWLLPDDCLERFTDDQLIAVSVSSAGLVTIVPAEPQEDFGLAQRLRAAYDCAIAALELPPYVKDLVTELLAAERTTFAQPGPPLDELIEDAGLERVGPMVAHDGELWTSLFVFEMVGRASERMDGDRDAINSAMEVIQLAVAPDRPEIELKAALKALSNVNLAEFVLEELTSSFDDVDEPDNTTEFVSALLRSGRTGISRAVAQWFAALVAETMGDCLTAEAHLKKAVSSGADWPPALERMAWYESDRGNAGPAISLLRRLPDLPEHAIANLTEYDQAGPTDLGRNEPCWCGSGRKFKQCHLNQKETIPLPERVSWLCFKSVCYLEHQGPALKDEIVTLARTLAVDPSDLQSLMKTADDPLLMDVALVEGGYFEEFLADRGPLLPEDEVLLGQSWLLVNRTVYEVVEVQVGVGMTVRDLATADLVEVKEKSFSYQAKTGLMVCGRAVPDGHSHQFIGGMFKVKPGTEEHVLDLCAAGDPVELCAWVAAESRPPRLVTRDGEEIVSCVSVWAVNNPKAARRLLNKQFTAEGIDSWIDKQQLGEDDNILRAQISLDEDRLKVTTMSVERMERITDWVGKWLPVQLISDDRVPFVPGPSQPPLPGFGPEPDAAGPVLSADSITQLQHQLEQTWMSEPVPALSGLTPTQAAADPTRREQLERLLSSFEELDTPPGAITFRVDRLREELGI